MKQNTDVISRNNQYHRRLPLPTQLLLYEKQYSMSTG